MANQMALNGFILAKRYLISVKHSAIKVQCPPIRWRIVVDNCRVWNGLLRVPAVEGLFASEKGAEKLAVVHPDAEPRVLSSPRSIPTPPSPARTM